MRSYLKNLAFLAFVFILSCSGTPTQIERTNQNDPESETFTVEPVQNLSVNILEEKKIELVWTDTSIVPTHYVIQKRINTNSDFQTLDTLDADKKSFIDNSKEIDLHTSYLIYSIRKQQNDSIKTSVGINSGIDFGDLVTQTYSYNTDTTAIVFNWEFESDWPFTVIITTYDNDLEKDVVLDTLSNTNTYTTPAFERDFQDKFFDLKFFVSDINIDLENPYKRYSGLYHILDFIPEITNIEVVNEGKVVINWKDNSGFEDGFRILRSKGFNRNEAFEPIVIAELNANTTSFTDTQDPLTGYVIDGSGIERQVKTFYDIEVFKNNTKTGIYGYQVNFTPPNITLSVSDLTTESFKLQWSTNSLEKVSQFTLQASSNGNSFFDYKTFQNETFNSTESNLSTNSVHYFRVKSKTSKYSDRIALQYSSYLVEEANFPFTNSRNIRFSDSGNLIIVSKTFFSGDADSEDVGIFDINNNSTLYNDAPIAKPINGVDIDEENNLMALTSYENQLLTIYNFDTNAIEYNASLNVFDVEFGPENKFVYTNSARDEVYKVDLINKSLKSRKPPFSTTSSLRSISLSPTGDSIAYNSDGFFRLLNSSNFRPIEFSHVLDYGSTAQKVNFSKSGKYISNVSDFDKAEIHFTNPASRYLQTGAEHISISFNDKLYITAKGSLLRLFELSTKKQLLSHSFSGEVFDLRFSPSEELVAVGSANGLFLYRISAEKKWSLFEN
ncbi:MAG: WD40 repeat domain-containing protein [Balneola sp.]|nr:WD40 repeat domain-containing protein [Balneola sp.]MBO6650905.1 WD40 repeat domain-containing protein [Balneola sp.]MBO6711847.1 WD40 repeat domain-containing protein [Balneola sp.]MBO6800042.1 WD40 repeat domain-containing protein [Balneola sp.]MBO6871577.1 WD40 repeat domain-containing protein [Balneola sp.]